MIVGSDLCTFILHKVIWSYDSYLSFRILTIEYNESKMKYFDVKLFEFSHLEPPNHIFGWLYAIIKVEEVDVLYMVGLDAYMLLRYHVVCLRLCIFLSICGLVVLVPTYGTATSGHSQWDKFTLVNVLASNDRSERDRVWLAVIFGYIFSAYFCQLLYNEYNNFSNERLRCLVSSTLCFSHQRDFFFT